VVIAMTDYARAILDRARETLERTADITVERRDHDDDALTRWSRTMPKPAPKPKLHQPTADEINRLRSHDWTAFVDGRNALAIAPVLEAVGQCIATERTRSDVDNDKIEKRVAKHEWKELLPLFDKENRKGQHSLGVNDAQYLAEEYPAKIGWGHSPMEYAVDVACAADARRLALYHHDPTRTDAEVDVLVERAWARARALHMCREEGHT